MAGEIKQKIVLEGEKEYSEAIKAAQRNLRTLRSELKAETAELGNNATAQQKNAAKIKSLKQQIQEQEKIVETYKAGLAEVREKYGDNADAIAQWEQKLNGARATLANMRNSLDNLGDGMGNVSETTAEGVTAAKSFADALNNIGSVGESVSGAIENIFSGVIDSVTDTVTQLWDLISETAARANRWGDIAGYWNTEAQTIQQWDRAVSSAGKSFDDLQGAVSRIVLGGKGKDITEMLGISSENYQDDWAYAMAVMDQINEMKKAGGDMTPIYETIFGEKKSQKVMDLINAWDYIKSQRSVFDGNTSDYGLTDEELETMGNVWTEINNIQTKWDDLKSQIAGGLGTVTLDIMTNAEGALDALAKFMNTDDEGEREKALEDFQKNIKELFEKVAAAIREGLKILGEVGEELKTSDDPVVKAIGEIMSGITGALEWMVNNQDKVKLAFETIFGAWLIAKLASVGTKLASIVANIGVIKTFSAMGGAGVGANTAGTAVGATAGTSVAGLLGAIGLNGLAALAVTELVKAMPADTHTKIAAALGLDTEADHIIDEVDAQRGIKTMGDKMDDMVHQQQATGQNPLQNMFGFLFGGGNNNNTPEAEKEAESAEGSENKPRAFDIASGKWVDLDNIEAAQEAAAEAAQEPGYTPEQQAAAEAFWDAWRAYGKDENDETQGAFGKAWEEYEAAFAGEEKALEKMDELMDQLIKDNGERWVDVEDLPNSWFGSGGQLTSADMAGFRGLPAQILAAVQTGAANGVSQVTVNMDGYAVGRLVAPYVSQTIARDIIP